MSLVIDRTVRRIAAELASEIELRIIRSLDPDPWPRYLTVFPLGSVPLGYRKRSVKRLGNKLRRQLRFMKKAKALLLVTHADEIERDFAPRPIRQHVWQV